MMTEESPLQNIKSHNLFHPFSYSRRKTREVMVGSVGVGGNNPIRLQSMTTTPTDNTEATVLQTLKMVEAGCEIVRITAPTVLDAQNLENIKAELLKRGCTVPLVADIHFRPDAAMVAADFVEKVRINPGNFVDGKAFKVREYSDQEYVDELKRLEDKFTPLVEKLKRLKRALRIGTNHGSLSDRIMNRFGDTPLGMVESALEYVRICRKNNFHDVIFSMKASNPRVMIQAYRLLAFRLAQENMDYPFHLGVTEAGDGEDGRIKSAAGIGSLLEDGIGDTIRVSLTEDPELEIPVAREIAKRYSLPLVNQMNKAEKSPKDSFPPLQDFLSPSKRISNELKIGPVHVGGNSPIRIYSTINLSEMTPSSLMEFIELRLKKDTPPEIIEVDFQSSVSSFLKFQENLRSETSRIALVALIDEKVSLIDFKNNPDAVSFTLTKTNKEFFSSVLKWCSASNIPLILNSSSIDLLIEGAQRSLDARVPVMVALNGKVETFSIHAYRQLAWELKQNNLQVPLCLHSDVDKPGIDSAVVLGALICDGIGDAISVSDEKLNHENVTFSYNLLQACGNRLTKTEYVSCPSCGRTLFDLQSTTERIKSKTGHLKGVKIAIMGCIVNGPGEMADADFGYVGGGPGKINLYVGKTCVEKSIPADIADEKLITLIKSHGKWVEPVVIV